MHSPIVMGGAKSTARHVAGDTTLRERYADASRDGVFDNLGADTLELQAAINLTDRQHMLDVI